MLVLRFSFVFIHCFLILLLVLWFTTLRTKMSDYHILYKSGFPLLKLNNGQNIFLSDKKCICRSCTISMHSLSSKSLKYILIISLWCLKIVKKNFVILIWMIFVKCLYLTFVDFFESWVDFCIQFEQSVGAMITVLHFASFQWNWKNGT